MPSAMRARTWFSITGYDGNLTRLVKSYEKVYKGANMQFGNWWYDQVITTHALLANKICTTPKEKLVWKMFSLTHDENLLDRDTCWHGRGYTPCKFLSSHRPMLCHGCSSYEVKEADKLHKYQLAWPPLGTQLSQNSAWAKATPTFIFMCVCMYVCMSH